MLVPVSAALLGILLAPDEGEARGSVSASEGSEPWIRRHRPQRNMLHLGVFGGVLLPARDIELFETDPTDPDQGFRSYRSYAPELGGRLGFFPLDVLGLEVEGAFGLGQVAGSQRASLWAVRGHVIGQVPRWSVTPFVLAGAGALGVRSGAVAVGNDTDLAFHMGGGLMVHLTRALSLRVELRNTITPQQGPIGGATNNPEILFGIGWTRRPQRQPEPRPIPSTPLPAVDTDGDGFIDDEDGCPEDAGGAPNGCPDLDPDNDGVFGGEDACPDEAGTEADGCPSGDHDHDGILDDVDGCVADPETLNGFEDEDGCPDVLPAELKTFEGALEGVTFDVGSTQLQDGSKRKLDGLVAAMKKYPTTRVELSGHTDSSGARDRNMELAAARADAVKAYLVQQGVKGTRVETRGAGPDEPIDTNATPEGRAHNRRIELRVLD